MILLSIQIVRSRKGNTLLQRKYVIDILADVGMLRAELLMHQWNLMSKLLSDQGEILDDPGTNQRLMGKLKYLNVTKPNIAFLLYCELVSFSTKDHSWGCNNTDSQILKKTSGKGLPYLDVDTPELLISHMLIWQHHPLTYDLPQTFAFSL